MNRALLSKAVGDIDESFIAEACRPVTEDASGSPERILPMNRKRIISLALAATFILALGIIAYAAWDIHAAKQQELKTDLKIERNHIDSYVEYPASDDRADGLVLLSAVNDGQEQHVYVNISPVSREEAAAFPENARYVWSIEGTETGGFAAPQLPVELDLSGSEEIRAAVLEHAYDEETQTMTLQCYLGVDMVRKAMETLGTDDVPLSVTMLVGDNISRSFGPIPFTLTEEQTRVFDFHHAVYHDTELDKEIEIAGLELTPFSAVWKVHYEGDAAFHTPEADWDAYADWSLLEDKVCIETQLVFTDGSVFSTGGALTCPYKDGFVQLWCSWGAAIDVSSVEQIVLGDLVLWENK